MLWRVALLILAWSILLSAAAQAEDPPDFILEWGSVGAGDGKFAYPIHIDTDVAGDVYVGDDQNFRVQIFTGSGAFLDNWTIGGQPQGVAVDASGNVYVTDTFNHRIKKFTNDGTLITMWGRNGGDGTSGTGDGEFNMPWGLALDGGGNVYVADTWNHRIQKFDASGVFITKWGRNGGDGSQGSGDGEFTVPSDVAVGPDGSVYVPDFRDRVQKFDGTGVFLMKWGSAGSGDGQFADPYGIGVGADSCVYVSDTSNYRVQKFTANGMFLTKWGSYGNDEGEFDFPTDVAVDVNGDIFVCDSYNCRIQKFGTLPDLQVLEFGAPAERLTGGDTLTVTVTVGCSGGAADPFGVAVYISADSVITAGDVLLGAVGLPGLGSGEDSTLSLLVTLPGDAPRGEVWLGVIVDHLDQVAEADEDDNTAWSAFSYPVPLTASIADVGNDQGRVVRINLLRSDRDKAGSSTPILQYEVFRRIDPLPGKPAPVALGADGVAIAVHPPDAMLSDLGILLAGWEFVGAIPAHGEDEYNLLAPTLADSTVTSGMHWSVFFIRAATGDPLVFIDSPPDSGYSVDNLAPAVPEGLSAAYASGGTTLEWEPCEDADFSLFRVYRDGGSGPVLVHETGGTSWFDAVENGWQYTYTVTAVDFSGNESVSGTAATTVGVGDRIDLTVFRLHPAAPNPFMSATEIRFDLPSEVGVRLDVFDPAGRLVVTLVDEALPRGEHLARWDGRDDGGRTVPSGVYFYRLRAGAFEAHDRLVLLR